jgi:hypothetical protein
MTALPPTIGLPAHFEILGWAPGEREPAYARDLETIHAQASPLRIRVDRAATRAQVFPRRIRVDEAPTR